MARDAFGEEVVDHYLNYARVELEAFEAARDRLGASTGLRTAVIVEAVFAPVQSTTAFEETLERLGTAIKLGLLPPGTRLPPERDLCEQLGIARSTLRQALTALVQSGHLHAVRGRGGGTFVVREAARRIASPEELADWRDRCDVRFSVELGVAFAGGRAGRRGRDRARCGDLVDAMAARANDFAGYRHADVRFHVGLAEATGSPALVAAITEAQGAMTDLIPTSPTRPRCWRGRTRSTRGCSTA